MVDRIDRIREIKADPKILPADVRGDYGDMIREELVSNNYNLKDIEPTPDYEELCQLDEADRRKLGITEIGLAQKTSNMLEGYGVWTVDDLLGSSVQEIAELRNIGVKVIADIHLALGRIKMDYWL